MRPRPKRSRARPRFRPGRLRLAALLLGLAGLAAAAWLLWPFWQLSATFADRPQRSPSRLYGHPLVVTAGETMASDGLRMALEADGYFSVRTGRRPAPGEYAPTAEGLLVHRRSGPGIAGLQPPRLVAVAFARGRVLRVTVAEREVSWVSFGRPLLASYYGPEREERRLAAVEDLPQHLVRAVLAAEDASFFHHPGLSLSGMLRAAWVNLRGREVRQGGSTLTQQLVKNLFLTHERTLARKLRELVLAVLIDWRYTKAAILGAYLNEIYWGVSGSANLIGVGAASQVYFGKPPTHLSLCESALLAGMIRSPGSYSPLRYPDRARERRDWVLGRMVEEGWLEAERAERERNSPLCVSGHPLPPRRAGYFLQAAAAEARRRFGVDELAGTGFSLLSTLSLRDQEAAEAAVTWGVKALEEGWEKDRRVASPLQAALISVDPASGGIRAYVGGRDFAASQFDRVALARRQAGSAFKPVVYAAAFENGVALPSYWLRDEPLTVRLAADSWSPRNSDGEYRGWVTVRSALERSLNVPTARLALATDLEKVVDMARSLGIRSPLRAYPALALGAFEVTPLELAGVFATLAAGGMRVDLHGLEALLGPDGTPLEGKDPPVSERVLSEETAYLVTSVLQGVLERGTGSSARTLGVSDPLAGKTGTTNDRRDSWFGGYSGERATLVWVGYDDSSPSRLSGARAALPIWARFVWAVRPPGGYRDFRPPPGVATVWIDPQTGELATDRCPTTLLEAFPAGRVPRDACSRHGGWRLRRGDLPAEGRGPRVGEPVEDRRRWKWLRKLFRRKGRQPEDPPGSGDGSRPGGS